MNGQQSSYDDVWDDIYARGHTSHAPWDAVVSFLFRNAPKDKTRNATQVLEVGCGTAPNLLFAAQQGFSVSGLDASARAIEVARTRFADAGLSARLEVGNFASLPFADAFFDLVIDRGAITCSSFTGARQCLEEIVRVVRPGGRLFFNPYSDRCSSASSGQREDCVALPGGLRKNITEGTLVGVGQVCFYNLSNIAGVLTADRWELLQVQHMEWSDCLAAYKNVHAEYRIIAEKRA